METTVRAAGLQDLAELLKEQHARKVDVVAPASAVSAREGLIVVKGSEPELTEEGVTQADGTYRPTEVFIGGLSKKLDIPVAYLRRMHNARPDLFDANVNGWLHGRRAKGKYDGPTWVETRPAIPGESRSFMLRCFQGDSGPGDLGIARAFLSNSYEIIDNLDVLMAALKGIQESGLGGEGGVQIESADLTERRMVVRVRADEVTALAPTLLKGYRSPFTHQTGDELPVLSAGFQISNSETGGGAFTIVPRLVVQICSNGLTITKDALYKTHLGGRLSDGVIRYGADTQEKEAELVTLRTRDAVNTFLSREYIERQVTELEEAAGAEVNKPEETVRSIGKKLKFTEEQQDGILGMFIKGGQMTRGGVMQAVTAYAQEVQDPDAAYDLEAQAVAALTV